MKSILPFYLFTFLSSFLMAQNNSKDSIAVRSVIQQYENAWNKNDIDAICKLFTVDGSWINPGGLYWKNQAEVSKAHHAFAQVLSYMIPVEMTIQNIQFIKDGVALVFVLELIHINHNLSFPNGKKSFPGDIIKDQVSLVLVKNSDQWQIKAGHITTIEPAAEAINPVK